MNRILLLLLRAFSRGASRLKSTIPIDFPGSSMCTRYRTCTSHSLMRSLTSQISPCFRGILEYKKGLINKFLVNIWIKASMKVLMHGIKTTLPAITVWTTTTCGFLEFKWRSSSNQMMKAANIHTIKCQAQLPSKLEGKCP